MPVDTIAPIAVSNDVRDSMCRLPKALAVPLTMLTGKPHTGQSRIRFTPTTHLLNASGSVLTGLVISGIGMRSGGWWLMLLAVGWATTLHGMRNLRMMIYHQCAHQNMWGRKRLDVILGKVIAALLLVQHFGRYSTEHVADHHGLHHMTLRDPTVQAFLVTLELSPGMSQRQMWRRVLAKLASPRFHANFMIARVRSHFHPASRAERAGTLGAAALGALLTTWWHAWLFVLVAWVLPLTVFYQISNTLRLCVKHTFPRRDTVPRRGKKYFASLTNAIFLGEAAPSDALPMMHRTLAWMHWSLRMLLVHFPARYLVLTGDTVCHDFHHRHSRSKDWANYIFAREEERISGHQGWPAYQEVWGLVPAIDVVLASLSAADPNEYSRQRLADVNQRELFTAFDD